MRLVTRSDFDGLACAAILVDVGVVNSWTFAHPKDLQDGIVKVGKDDVLANVPFVKGCGLWFDHHTSEVERADSFDFQGSWVPFDSAAHVIYDYYKDQHDLSKFEKMLEFVDRVDAGKLTKEEILNPEGWILLGFIMDPRTGLGRFKNFAISNYQLMEKLINLCRNKPINEILADPDVKQRVDLYHYQAEKYKEMIIRNTQIHGNLILTDLRKVEPIFAGNRFMIYGFFPEQNISAWIVESKVKNTCSIAVGYSILNRTSTVDVGSVMLSYGGGGHTQVGTCQVHNDICDRVIRELITKLQ